MAPAPTAMSPRPVYSPYTHAQVAFMFAAAASCPKLFTELLSADMVMCVQTRVRVLGMMLG